MNSPIKTSLLSTRVCSEKEKSHFFHISHKMLQDQFSENANNKMMKRIKLPIY